MIFKGKFKKVQPNMGGEISAQIIGLIDDVKSAPPQLGSLCGVLPGKSFKTSKLSNINRHQHGQRFIFASFHGDTDGLATIPVVTAVKKYMTLLTSDESAVAWHRSSTLSTAAVFGMDANTYKVHNEGKRQGVSTCETFCDNEIANCWGLVSLPQMNFGGQILLNLLHQMSRWPYLSWTQTSTQRIMLEHFYSHN